MTRLEWIPRILALVWILLAVPAFAATASSDDSDSADSGAASEVLSSDDDAADGDSDAGSSSGTSSDSQATPPPPAPSSGSSVSDKFQIHGFLTQAWATASFVGNRFPGPAGDPGPTFDELALGIPEDGTFDYRTLALQFRYEISPQDIMIVQLSSRALGESPIGELEDEFELDWAFYERRLTDDTSIKVGRVQIPLGIFNEIRDVGTILPFYRPPFLMYREGSFTSETVDGVVLSHVFGAASDWNLEADIFAGRWESVEQNPLAGIGVATAENEGFGFQLWLNTPVSGLRFGLGGHQRDVTEGAEGILREVGATTPFDDWYFSVEAVFERFVFRSEYRKFENDPVASPVFFARDFSSEIASYYVQVGYYINEKIRVYAQYEQTDSELMASVFTRTFDVSLRDDTGIALNYRFTPGLVLKAEYHEVGGEDLTFAPAFGPAGFQLMPLIRDLSEGDYSIVSFSVSF